MMIIEDQELGIIRLKENPRSLRITARYKDGFLQVSYPKYISQKELLSALSRMKPKLIGLKERAPSSYIFRENKEFQTLTFTVQIKRDKLSNAYVALKNEFLYITIPENEDIQGDEIQRYIKQVVEAACRSEANRVLLYRVTALAAKYHFEVNRVKINNSRGRWGSCSSKKNINLSYFCMMLPMHLVDLVILHELCHTQEMNHGKNFWVLLNSVTDNRAESLTKELKAIKLGW